ncbi:hypothetical protein [Streptomyces sp. URMC 125]|uniref:hypothetical protein n=1 Tax=Streptomyces sp. URMC 125 TaxID=3423419 RepID=UPI003F1D5309
MDLSFETNRGIVHTEGSVSPTYSGDGKPSFTFKFTHRQDEDYSTTQTIQTDLEGALKVFKDLGDLLTPILELVALVDTIPDEQTRKDFVDLLSGAIR